MIASTSHSQNFVSVKDSSFLLSGNEFKFFGFNAYYLQTMASDSDKKYIVDDVFNIAKNIGIKVIRMWAFNDNDSITSSDAIRNEPLKTNEAGLISLDYVLNKAYENNIYLILTLGNNYKEFGGIPQYVRWARKYLSKKTTLDYSHNDFFVNDSIKQWYKFYVEKLLNRRNTFNGLIYKNDPTIFSFELLNEADNPKNNYSVVENWYKEMSTFIKSLDSNHLVTTGEIGYDAFENLYSDADFFYNGSHFLINGYKGTSFNQNSFLKNIDYLSFHCYPDGWGLSAKAGITWIKDHYKIAWEFNKPILLGEFGIKNNKLNIYEEWLDRIKKTNTKSAIVWQYLHPDLYWGDGYDFNENNSPELINLFKNYIKEINSDTTTISQIPDEIVLHQNFPNPFNPVTTIKYNLPEDDNISLQLFNTIGERVKILEDGFRKKGEHEIILSFDNNLLASGVYIYALKTSKGTQTKKLTLLK